MDKWLIADTSENNIFEYTARGFDLRCQYRIPQHPQLRLNLVGERYFGEIVHNNSIVHNRSAVTVGFDYTPIPFVTASYGFNLDNAQNKAHQLQLSLTYRLGIPIAEQFKPRQIHIARSLLSNRLDLVQRNHQIILEQLIKLREPKFENNNPSSHPQNRPSEGAQEPKFENNNASSHPQNRPSEGAREPEVGLHAIFKVKKCNSVGEALALLGLSPTIISSNIEVDIIHHEIRSAYRKLARDYHPDKSSRGKTVEQNEELRAIRFETLQKTYEYLKECGLKG